MSLSPVALEGRIEDEPGLVHGVVAVAVGLLLAQALARSEHAGPEAGPAAEAAHGGRWPGYGCAAVRDLDPKLPPGGATLAVGVAVSRGDEEPRRFDRMIDTWVVWELELGTRGRGALSSGG